MFVLPSKEEPVRLWTHEGGWQGLDCGGKGCDKDSNSEGGSYERWTMGGGCGR